MERFPPSKEPTGTRMSVYRADDDRELRLQMLPMTSDCPVELAVFVAEDKSKGKPLGAAALAREVQPSRPVSVPIALSVGEGVDSTPVEAALLQAAAKQAREWRGGALMAWGGAERRSDEAARWERLGFERRIPLAFYEGETGPYHAMLSRLVDRLRSRGRIPESARILSLKEAPLGQILQLHLINIGGDAGGLFERLRGRGPRPFHPDLSIAIMKGDELGAFLLVRIDYAGRLYVDTRVVVPSFRGDWANALLMGEVAKRSLELGLDRFGFIGGDRHADTHKLARRVDAATRIMDNYVKPLA